MMKHGTYTLLFLLSAAALLPVPASHAANTYLAVVNVNGADDSAAEYSGTLPGTSPATIQPLLRTKDGRPIPLWYDRVFPALDPALLEETKRLIEDKKKIQPTIKAKTYGSGEQKKFWVKDDNDAAWRQVTASVKKTGSHSYIFVDDTLSVPDASLELYVTEFETMYSVLAANLGTFSDRDDNGKTSILLYDMNDGGSINGYMGGYFWSKDYYADALTSQQGLRSNEMDVIYIRGDKPEGWEQVGEDFYEYNLTTLVHEYQHLVHYGVLVWSGGRTSSDAWIDEMMAMAAETMYFKQKLSANANYTHPDLTGDGYLSSRIEYYNRDANNSIRNGHGLTYWDNAGDTLANYTLAYLFGQYLSLQAANGQGIFKSILDYMTAQNLSNYQAVAAVAAQKIPGITTWEDLLKNWAIANLVNMSTGLAGYKGAFTLAAHGPTSDFTNIYNSGIVYRRLYGDLTPPADAGPNVRFFVFDDAGAATGSSTSTAPAGSTTTTTAPAGTSTTTSIDDASTTTTTADGVCADPAFPHDCFDVNGGCCAEGYPICCPAGCCPESFPYCGDDGFCHETPQPSGLCPLELLLGEQSEEAEAVRAFRDTVLAAHPRGEHYQRLFYRHSLEVSALLYAHPALARHAYRLVADILPALHALGVQEKASLNKKTVADMLVLLEELGLYGSSSLRTDIKQLRQELQRGSLLQSFGIYCDQETDN